VREYLTVFLVAAVVTYLLGVVAREIALRTGAVARVRDRDVHAVPIPYFGGVAMLGGLGAAYLVAHRLPFLSLSDKQVFHDSSVVLVGGAMICVLGVLDDLFELDALTKLGGQVLAAGFLVVNQVQYFSFQLPGRGQFSLTGPQSALLSVVVVVATVNAVNFVDGLDGLAAGVVAIGAVAFFAFAYKLADANKETLAISAALLCAALGGACVGFLPHNFFPARIFMGDSGALLIGLMLACSAISLTGQFAPSSLDQGIGGANASILPTLLPLILPFAVLMIPLVDFTLAVVRRTLAGRSPYAPDRQHLHHRLLDMGHSHRRAVLLLYLWAALVAFGLVVVSLLGGWMSVAAVLAMAAAAVLLTFGVPGHRGLIGKQT
jgi:UDP-GlcNAc:undecaprenyl-phosphate/decaprenyl-phosphate GlcNAc-1-phosphate transferase